MADFMNPSLHFTSVPFEKNRTLKQGCAINDKRVVMAALLQHAPHSHNAITISVAFRGVPAGRATSHSLLYVCHASFVVIILFIG